MIFLYLLLLPFFLYAEQLSFSGHVSSTDLEKALEKVQKIPANDTLYIQINSNSADLKQVLNFAKKIYELKSEKKIRVVVYINENAIGPTAILPFLADERYASIFVSWGDISVGSEGQVPVNILRKEVVGLIDDKQQLLKLIAAAMCDPVIQIVDDNGWKLATKESKGNAITTAGETLVLNQNELHQLGLVKDLITPIKFQEMFGLAVKGNEPLEISPSEFEQKLKEHITVKEGANFIGHIKIDDRTSGISQSTWIYVKKALDSYKELKPDFIILELNTPGGEVFAAQKISDALKEMDTQYNIPVVAYINNWAISAGAMLAYSCRFITTVKDGSMGAAEPVIQGEKGEMQSASEKINSALRADFANRARFFDRNPDIAEAMVDKDIILVLRHGQVVRLDNEDQLRKTGPDPDKIISAKGKLLTLSSEEMLQYGVADLILLPKKVPLITDAEETEGKWAADKMLLFHYPFFDTIPNAIVVSYRMDWKTQFLSFLATPMVASILFLGMMLGFYIEFNTPGFGVPGTVGLLCLFLIILSSFALEVGNMLELILLVTGIAIIAVELFVLPTFGLLGFIGILFFIVGLFGMMLPGIDSINYEFDTGTFNAAGEEFMYRLAWLAGTFILGLVIMILLGRYLVPSFAGFNRFVLKGHEQEGFHTGGETERLPQVGQKGTVIATLRPAGKVMIDNIIYDAMSGGDFIEKETPVIVSRIESGIVVVEEDESRL